MSGTELVMPPDPAALELSGQKAEGNAGANLRQILYCRTPGLLARAAKLHYAKQERVHHCTQDAEHSNSKRMDEAWPLAVSDGKRVRDACPFAVVRGIQAGQSVTQARRLCPNLTVLPLEHVDARSLTARFLDFLADLSPTVEPAGADTAFADVTGGSPRLKSLEAFLTDLTDFFPAIGLGPSKLAARACAECGLPPENLGDASVDWLWPEDALVVQRLKRLGLETFDAVAEIGEDALFYQFGRIGRLLHRRAQGQDLASVKALYPSPRADDRLDLSEFPLADRTRLQAALARLSHAISEQLVALGRYGRRIVLRVEMEQEEGAAPAVIRGEWVTPTAVQGATEITRAAQRLLMTLPLTAPVTELRLLVEDLETAQAVTQDLFAGRSLQSGLALEAARRVLTQRYGAQALSRLSEKPQTTREKRRSAESETWQ